MSDTRDITIDEYDYPLPDERIARYPLTERDSCKLLVRTSDGELIDKTFIDLPDLLPAGSMLVYNNTRVINARLKFRKNGDGALIEIFCLEPHRPVDYAQSFACTENCQWLCFVGNAKKWKQGSLEMSLKIGDKEILLSATKGEAVGNARIVSFEWTGGVSFSEIISVAGEIPIPPYLNRETESSDASDYQTVFSQINGSVAAPTAGLHFTDRVLAAIDERGIRRRQITLHVGAGTFQPVKADAIGEHEMHSEFISVSRSLIEQLAAEPTPYVIAVGTTSVRTLESLYHIGCLISCGRWSGEVPQWYPYEADHPGLSVGESMSHILRWLDSNGIDKLVASTRIIIAPGYKYHIVKGMITNFHQPRSTLLLLVSAFMGDEWRRVYSHALSGDYRFLSYGDACLFL
ncbi:MAG: S-adenosylmethionine:tRNA ribosyltransferase-isomerase [Muribaculaceae bacterium]|nr:S-adenosylmethionine:tRNA ribosyltransferase-isomerase [Muribaculaceae bacterium]